MTLKPFPTRRLAYIRVPNAYAYWLPRSRYQPDNLPALEIYRQKPADIGWETFDIECCIPIIPL